MKNNVLTIMKKECSRIFNDRNLFLSTVVLPGLLLFVIYSAMGRLIPTMFAVDEGYIHQVHVVDMPPSLAPLFAQEELMISIINTPRADRDSLVYRIENQDTDLLVVFPQNFESDIMDFDPATATIPAPNIEVWSNSARSESSAANHIVMGVINSYHHNLTHRFTINMPSETAPDGNFDLATDADIFAMMIGIMVPLMFLIFLSTGFMTIAPESIAGEKERGTLGSMLVTPARRRDMALGKILGVAVFGLMSAIVSMVGMTLSLPGMMGLEGNIFSLYSVTDFILLLIVAATTTLVFVSLYSLMSAYAKSVKEANSYAQPVLLITMVCGMASMIMGGVPTDAVFYMIPIFNSSLSISAIFNFEVSAVNMAVTVSVNILVTILCAVLLARIFSSEKIVFDK